MMDACAERLEKSLSLETRDRMDEYHRLIQDGKDVAKRGDMNRALTLFKLAFDIHQSLKLETRIKKIEELISQNDSEEDDDEFVNVNGSGLMLFKDLHEKLYNYQRQGVAFLYSLYRDGLKGGILADDMGLGKTIQVISFLSGMYDSELVKHTLLIMPTSLITNWTKEFAKWTPGMRVKEFHGTSKGERSRNLGKVQRRGGIVITTYTMLMNNWQQLSSYNGKEFTWDYVILDEAHKIKTTTTKTAKSAYAIPSKHRVLLTGTPVQNNLKEMWSLFDFACQGTLLGTAKTFKTEYENPITRAREKDATPGEKVLGSRMSENLMTIIKPHFLRRTKADIRKNKVDSVYFCKEETTAKAHADIPETPQTSGAVMPTLTRKNDLIVWTYLSSIQEDIYRQFISLDHIKELLLTTRSPLAELTILKKLCDHPRLLSDAAITKLGLEERGENALVGDDTAVDAEAQGISNVSDETLISESGKLVFLFRLLERLREEGCRTLVFAHYRKVLDILERILGNRGFKVMRLDGTIKQITERERRISLFQMDRSYSVFLLTTQVGGVGITLTAANRVVIYDPSWNPATDAQAVDRAYRIGQTENVVIYRLITCGTVEEKIYRRQVFKDSLIRQSTGDKKNPFRYFSKQELKELFTLEETRSSSTQLQLQALHSRHRWTDPQLDEHIAHLHGMEMFGISDHDLMFSLDINHDETPEDQVEHHYIEGRVQKAQELMKAESELQMQLTENMASSTEPTWLRQPRENRSREHSHEKNEPKTSPSFPQQDWNSSPEVKELDQSDSGGTTNQQNRNSSVIDLTVEIIAEKSPVAAIQNDSFKMDEDMGSSKIHSDKQEKSSVEAAEASQESSVEAAEAFQEVIQESLVLDSSITSETAAVYAGDRSQPYLTAVEDDHILNETLPSKPSSDLHLEEDHLTPPQNSSASALRPSNLSIKAETSSSVSPGLACFQGDFNLRLEDSEVFSDQEVLAHQERNLLSQLQINSSFDVNKSLSEWHHKEELHQSLKLDPSENDSIILTKKKGAAVIYDTDDDEDDDERKELSKSQLDSSFQILGASTPKSVSSDSRKSIGGNTSVASRRSLLCLIINDMENQDQDDEDTENEDQDGEDMENEDQDGEDMENRDQDDEDTENHDQENDIDMSERYSNEAKLDDVIVPRCSELQLEETREKTLNTEEEVEPEDRDSESREAMSCETEEPSTDPELGSSERVDHCTVEMDDVVDTFESLVSRGKEHLISGQLENALDFFLRAIDIKPGDPEVQLMTIQLYRQLSHRS
ncbi:DNA excision repair protein ERCC-6-like [Takifugu flavidus]|uniref:DNA excision repair protein ERCC-6-like n=1 Tax=Takifugu flavidus TaxID=433684 RepID=A0A5C6N0E6_9TELE|nr:DNA excision repair protein ERCC-6-like [Takifugu flavidus]TWW60922.1 DNA excision repair protein ERCC-6-like [Takifugu flavidus]